MVRVEQLMTRELACIESTQAVSVRGDLMRSSRDRRLCETWTKSEWEL